MQTTTHSEASLPTPVLTAICTLLFPCAISVFVLLAGPPEWREPTWHTLHLYTAVVLGLLGILYIHKMQPWNGEPMTEVKPTARRRSTLWLSLSLLLVILFSLSMPAVIGVGGLLLGFFVFKNALARQDEALTRVPQWYSQLGDQLAAWIMIFLGLALGTVLL
jgi:hypothetical protein